MSRLRSHEPIHPQSPAAVNLGNLEPAISSISCARVARISDPRVSAGRPTSVNSESGLSLRRLWSDLRAESGRSVLQWLRELRLRTRDRWRYVE